MLRMAGFLEYLEGLLDLIPIFRSLAVVIVMFVILNLALRTFKKSLLKRAKTKKQISNIEIFSKILNYFLLVVVLISAIFSYSG